MLKEKEVVIQKAMAVLDAIVLAAVFMLTFFLRRNFHEYYKFDFIPSIQVVKEMSASITDYLLVMVIIVPLWCLGLYLVGMYSSMRTKTIPEIARTVIKSAFVATIAFGTIVFLFKLEFISRVFFILFLANGSITILAEKSLIYFAMRAVRKRGYNLRRILIVGTGRRAVQFMSKIESHPEWGLKIVGAIDYEDVHVGKTVDDGVKVMGSIEGLPKILETRAIDEVVFVVPRSQLGQIENHLYTCETRGIKTTIAVDLFDLKIAKLRQTELEGIPLITFETTPTREWQLLIKRAFDLVASGFGIVILSLFFLVVAILIKLTSQGPVLYIQKRVGLNGRKFIFYKFRSMYKGSHERLSELSGKNEMTGPVFKIKDDPRITPLGKFLRKTSIDELPQLFNVFKGEMSLVGPRPLMPHEVAKYEPWQRRRLSMRPGITCIWQVSGRNKIGFDEWMKMDLQYIDNWSLWLDIKIMFRTIPVVLFGVGAY
ncbi:MAG: sugar transferase [Candidatus Omnitrophica bacterium]|nr:sugar transferase [Candidatus Omnitrophota bacterium]